MAKSKCPRLRFEVTAGQFDDEHVRIKALNGKRLVGVVAIGLRTGKDSKSRSVNAPFVSLVSVTENLQRCGLATRLYTKAAKYACDNLRRPLQSDTLRTAASDGFWRKQVSKGRAGCVQAANDTYAKKADPTMAIEGRNKCAFYTLKSCAGAADLTGPRRRGKRK